MESATLLTMCNTMALKAGFITGVISERTKKEKILENFISIAENNAISVAVEAVKRLLKDKQLQSSITSQ